MFKPLERLFMICDGVENMFPGPLYFNTNEAIKKIFEWVRENPTEFFNCLNVRNSKALGVKRKIWLMTALQGGKLTEAEKAIADLIIVALRKSERS